jgi:bifunctional DNA-binding transcriptional regulator/antitoxin component of YhaV-PrlF toxin-antitoxin module
MEQFKFDFVKKMSVFEHGSSMAANIPAEIVKMLQISVGDKVAFFADEQHKVGFLVPAKEATVLTSLGKSSLGFSVNETLLKKLLADEE